MIHQARAETTRQTILAAAVEVLDDVGYSNVSLTEVIDRAGVTKGAFYYHFPTKTALAWAVIADSDTLIKEAIETVWDPSSTAPALEGLVRAAFVVADRARLDKRVSAGIQLTDTLSNPANRRRCERHRVFLADVVAKAISQGDIRTGVNVEDLGHALWVSLMGSHLLSAAAGEDRVVTLARVLRIMLAGVCADRTAPFFEQFVDRLAHIYVLPAAERLV